MENIGKFMKTNYNEIYRKKLIFPPTFVIYFLTYTVKKYN